MLAAINQGREKKKKINRLMMKRHIGEKTTKLPFEPNAEIRHEFEYDPLHMYRLNMALNFVQYHQIYRHGIFLLFFSQLNCVHRPIHWHHWFSSSLHVILVIYKSEMKLKCFCLTMFSIIFSLTILLRLLYAVFVFVVLLVVWLALH